MQTEPVIKMTSVNYNYSKDIQTLFDICMQVNQGDIYGFLGPNGSGKTTTLSILLGLLKPKNGTVEIFGKQMPASRIDILKKTGSLIETPSLYGHLSARANLEVYRNIYRVSSERIEEVLEIVGLEEIGRKPVRKYSLGMKQRLSIALALLQRPELLILDEPTNGLDPNGIVELRDLLKELNYQQGTTILISSHILAEVEKLVTQIGIISHGRMVYEGPLKALHHLQQAQLKLHLNTSDNETAIDLLKEHHPEKEAEYLSLQLTHIEEVASINRLLIKNGVDVYLLQPQHNNLEQLFFDLTTNRR